MMMYSSLRKSQTFTISLPSPTTFSSGQIYCCFTRCLSGRCSMLKEIPLLRAPENKRTGMEIRPKVKCPDQTDDAIVPLVHQGRDITPKLGRHHPKLLRFGSLADKRILDAQILGHGESKCEAGGDGVGRAEALAVVVN